MKFSLRSLTTVNRQLHSISLNQNQSIIMHPFLAEFLGTALLLLLGNGVVANVVLHKTKGNSSGWIVITTGWALAVFVGVVLAGPYSGAHLNSAVTITLALAGKFEWIQVP